MAPPPLSSSAVSKYQAFVGGADSACRPCSSRAAASAGGESARRFTYAAVRHVRGLTTGSHPEAVVLI
jgi:hypothetical protein